ncbi:iron-containing alcohol dehydrogenase, partial [Klebsiella pneumoniae]
RDVGIPGHLREVGVRKEDIPALAQAALADVCTGGNPREASLAVKQAVPEAVTLHRRTS